MSYELVIVFSSPFLTAHLEIVALTTSRIYLMIYLIDITNIYKYVIKLANKNINFCANWFVVKHMKGRSKL